MHWINDWPQIGINMDKDGIGEPVTHFKKPDVGAFYEKQTAQESDEFDQQKLGLQWQWQANPQQGWAYLYQGALRMFSQKIEDTIKNYWSVPNLLLQKFPAETFKATTKIIFHPNLNKEKIGFIIMGMDYAYINLTKKQDGIYVSYAVCKDAIEENKEQEQVIAKLNSNSVIFAVEVKEGAVCTFSFSEDNKNFIPVEGSFTAKAGRWIGAKLGYFCSRTEQTNDSGFADIDWFRISAIENR